jgi:hypothetical protein
LFEEAALGSELVEVVSTFAGSDFDSADDLTSLVSSLVAFLNSRIAFPTALPSSGSRLGPNTMSTMIRMAAIQKGCMGISRPIIGHALRGDPEAPTRAYRDPLTLMSVMLMVIVLMRSPAAMVDALSRPLTTVPKRL